MAVAQNSHVQVFNVYIYVGVNTIRMSRFGIIEFHVR
jgi:hypothetical protein